MKLWQASEEGLQEIPNSTLNKESRLEEWVRHDPMLLGVDLLIIGQQVMTHSRGFIDLLALDQEGNLVVLELKRDKTPREVVAQILDYGSFVRKLTFEDLNEISRKYSDKSLSDAFAERFEQPLPDPVNQSHQLIILASALDESSERIVEYLTEEHNVPINVIFFTFFQNNGQEFLGRAWLRDPEETQEKAVSRKQAPWSGYYFVNVGESEYRNWDDCREYGFLAAGNGPKYSRLIRKLDRGDQVFAYMKGRGYVGFGTVTAPAMPAKDFSTPTTGTKLADLPLKEPLILHDADDPDLSDWVLAIDWEKTFPREEAKTFAGVFANQNIVCKLRHPPTVEFLKREFNV